MIFFFFFFFFFTRQHVLNQPSPRAPADLNTKGSDRASAVIPFAVAVNRASLPRLTLRYYDYGEDFINLSKPSIITVCEQSSECSLDYNMCT